MKELKKDREKVAKIISEMLYSPDESGMYPFGEANQKIAEYIQEQRVEAIGWMHAEACTTADKGEDIRKTEVSSMLGRAFTDLSLVPKRDSPPVAVTHSDKINELT